MTYLAGAVESLTMMFEDDTKLYRPVNNIEDRDKIWGDIDSLMRWSANWQLCFNVSKCKVIHYGSRNHEFSYSMNPDDTEDKMQITKEEKDIHKGPKVYH